ncbi:unnamed protein product [Brassica rapa subsp. narinosa]
MTSVFTTSDVITFVGSRDFLIHRGFQRFFPEIKFITVLIHRGFQRFLFQDADVITFVGIRNQRQCF